MGDSGHVQSPPGPMPGPGQVDGNYGRPGPMPQIKLTPEEQQVLKECRSESFWFRSVPYTAALMAGTHLLMQRGFLKPSGRAGKLLIAGITGYTIGKISYFSACKSKILKLGEGSQLAQMIRKGGRPFQQMFTEGASPEIPPSMSTSQREDVEITYDANKYKGLDERQRPNLDSVPEGAAPWQEQEEKTQSTVSYDDLRRHNRQMYEEKQAAFSRNRSPHPSPSPVQPLPKRTTPPRAQSQGSKKNEWGDVWEE